MLISECLESFIEHHVVVGSSEKTISFYKNYVEFFINFLNDKDINLVTYKDYKNYIIFLKNKKKFSGNSKFTPVSLTNKKLSSCTIRSYANAVKIFFKYCYKQDYMSFDLSSKIILPKQKNSVPGIISVEVMESILKSFDITVFLDCRDLLILVLDFDSGLRLSEIANLKYSDFNFADNFMIINGKGNKQRVVPISETIRFYLIKYISFIPKLKNEGLLLKKKDYTDINVNTIKLLFRRIKNKFNLPKFNPHLLRHSYATLYCVNGGNAISLQYILGHSTLDMTQKYVHIANSINISRQAQFSPLSFRN